MNVQKIDLVCLHHAGGSGSTFNTWKHIGEINGVNVITPSMPGRAELYKETIIRSPKEAIQWILEEVWGKVNGDFHLFGHSLGGQLAFHAVSAAVEYGLPLPTTVHISAARPGIKNTHQPIDAQAVTDEEALHLLSTLGGATEKQLANPLWLQRALPLLRDDLTLSRRLTACQGKYFPGHLNLYGGTEDTFVPVEFLRGWGEIADSIHLKTYDGGHFYLHETPTAAEDIIRTITHTKP